jgi:TRAP-type C4-dicarboxylate transport system substrate-binding protein
MKPRIFFRTAAIALVCFSWGFLGTPAKAQDVTLKFATINGDATRAFKEIQAPLVRAIEKDVAGRLKIDIRGPGPNGYGKPAEYLDLLRKGEIDIAYTVQGYTPGQFPGTTVGELPLMYRSSEDGTRALWGLYKEGLFDKEYAGLKVLALNISTPFGIFSANKPITGIKDFRGLRIRVPSPTVGLALARMGAIPIGLPLNLIGESISNHMVDAISYGADPLESLTGTDGKPVADLIKAAYDCSFAAPALMIVMNQKAYDALPKDVQKAIDSHTGWDLSLAMAKDRDTSEAAAKQRLQQSGRYTFTAMTPDQRDEMAKLIGPVIDEWKKSVASQGLDADKLLRRAQELAAQKTASAN